MVSSICFEVSLYFKIYLEKNEGKTFATLTVYKPKRTFEHTCKYCEKSYTNSKEKSSFCSFACSINYRHRMHKRNPKAMHTVKRTLKHIKLPSWLRIDNIPNYVLEQIHKRSWEYSPYGCERGHNAEYYRTRDKGMMSLGFLACGRINEVLRVERSQFDFESEPGFIVLTNFYVSKRKKTTIKREGKTFVDIPMPTNEDALLYPFTKLVTDYLAILEGEKLFPFGEVRAWQIIKHCTGLWSHWFRALGFTYFANKIKNPFALAKIYGIKNVNTVMRYFKTEWTAYRDIYALASRAERKGVSLAQRQRSENV